ncbi:MAG: hypothetical protein ACE5F5_07630 [Acidimicrobiia bacterium]
MFILIREAIRNIAATKARSVMLAGVLALAVGFPVWLDLVETTRALTVEAELAAAGRYIAIAGAESGVSRADCYALRNNPGVVGTASVRLVGPTEIATRPGDRYQMATAIPGSERVWGVSIRRGEGSLWLGEAVVEDLGGVPPELLAIGNPPTVYTVAGVLEARRNQVVERWLTVVVPPTGEANECWVEWRPEVYEAGLGAMPTLLGRDDLVARERLRRDEFRVDPVRLLEERTAPTVWQVVATLAVFVGWIVHRARRSEYALYRAVGFSLADLYFMSQTEVMALLVLIGPWSAALAVSLHTLAAGLPTADQISLALQAGGLSAAAVILSIPLGLLAMGRGGIADALKER